MKLLWLERCFGERRDRQRRGVAGEHDVGSDDGLRLFRRLLFDRAILEHGLDDEIAALELSIVRGRRDAREQRLFVGGLGATLGDLRADELVRIGLALVGRFLVAVDQHDIESGVRRNVGDAGAHQTRAEHADLAQVRRRHAGRASRALVEFAHRQEERTDHRRRFLRQQDIGEMLRLNRERQIHRQLQAFEHARQNRLGRGIIVVSFAAIDGVGRRPDHHALRRKNLAGRELEFRVVPGRLGVRIRLHPSLGERDDLTGGRDLVHEAHLLRGSRANLIALEQHLQSIRRRHQPRDALRAARAGKEADLDLRQSDARLVRIRNDAVVARQRQFETAAHAHAVDRGGHRFAAGLEAAVDERQLLRPVDERAHRGVLAFGLGAARVFLACGLEHRQVRSRREAILARGEDGAFDRWVACDCVGDLAELADDLGVDHVHRTARHVPGHKRNAVRVSLETKVGQVHFEKLRLVIRHAR